MPIHDQGYRRYGGERVPRGPAGSVIARAGIRTMLAKRAFLGLLLLAWLPFFVRAVQIYAAANLPQAAIPRADAETFRRLPRRSRTCSCSSSRVRRRRPHRERSPRERPADLPVEAADARRVHRSASSRSSMAFLLLVTWVPAIVLLIVQIAVCRQLHVLHATTSSCSRRSRSSRSSQVTAGRDGDAGAVVALEQQPVRRHPLCRPDLLHPGALRRRCYA